VLDTLSIAENNIKYLKKTFYNILQSTLMNIDLYTNIIKKVFFYLLYPTQSLDIVTIHMSDYQVTMYSDNF